MSMKNPLNTKFVISKKSKFFFYRCLQQDKVAYVFIISIINMVNKV